MKNIVFFILIAALAGGATWFLNHKAAVRTLATAATGASPERKILYYQSPMHPWIKSDKPGKCPICGMNLVPVYASDDATNAGNGIKLSADNVSVANVQTTPMAKRQIVRSLHEGGVLDLESNATWFVFTAYERDLAWLKTNQNVEVTTPALPDKACTGKITAIEPKPDDPTHSLQARAVLSENIPPLANGFYAEGRVIVNVPNVLAVPRSAVLSPSGEPFVYVDAGGGRYELRKIKVGRVGDDFAEVLDGLKEGDRVVTSGNLLIDAEAQISQNTDN